MSQKLRILNEGEIGYGVLIESDAGVITSNIRKEIILKENDQNGGTDDHLRILVDCILQKAGVKNRNGRIYPKHILERELRKYIQLVESNSSYGECVDELTEIFTTNGWKFLKDIADDEEVFTLNIENNQLEKEIIQAKIDKEYIGKMYHITNDTSIDMMLTPNHNMLIYDKYHKPFSLYTEQFVELINKKDESINESRFYQNWAENEFIQNLIDDKLKIEEIDFNGRVYCVKTNNTTWLMRRNGKIAWTHNCNHPDNPVISLKPTDVSHLIKKFWWEGDTLYGTLEIITSKGYALNGGIYCVGDSIANLLERGYKLGISSRGLGSLKTIRGENYVQEDFELICWDLVSSPSTPDAYLFKNIKKINENSQDTTKDLIKEDKILKFLNKKTIF